MGDWVDSLQLHGRPKHAALTTAIAIAVENGRLAPGDQLPTHRALAQRLELSVQTVGIAYQALQRRGIIQSVVGRGSFVASRTPTQSGAFLASPGTGDDIDLSVVQGLYTEQHEEQVRRTLRELATEDNSAWMYPSRPVSGLAHHREAAAGWLASLGINAASERIIITNGATQAIFLALAAVARPGDLVLTEHLTENGIIGAANVLGLRLRGLQADAEGIVPEAFEAACTQGKVTALIWVPTFGNPTGHLALAQRREQIAEIAARHGVAVIEDEVYKPLLGEALPSIVDLLPDLGFTATGVSKSVMTGLRVGYLAAPHSFCLRAAGILRANSWNTAPLMTELAYRWMCDGTAARLVDVQRRELRARNAAVAQILSRYVYLRHELAPVSWLDLPEGWKEEALLGVLRERGVLVTGSRLFSVDAPSRRQGVRVGLSGAVPLRTLHSGLQIIAATFEQLPPPLA